MLKSCIVAWGANLKKYIISEERNMRMTKNIHNISSKSSMMVTLARK